MPIYEFFSPDNRRIYSFFARSLAYAGKVPRCPDNPKFRMERMISNFSFTGRAREPQPGAREDAPPPGLDAAIAEMERQTQALDPDNPDPRMVARMMRTVTELGGEPVTEQMEEVFRRLEEGESVDQIEEKFGAVADEVGSMEGEEGALARAGQLENIKARLRAAHQRPVRDPVMYEMADFVDLVKTPARKLKAPRKRPAKK